MDKIKVKSPFPESFEVDLINQHFCFWQATTATKSKVTNYSKLCSAIIFVFGV